MRTLITVVVEWERLNCRLSAYVGALLVGEATANSFDAAFNNLGKKVNAYLISNGPTL